MTSIERAFFAARIQRHTVRTRNLLDAWDLIYSHRNMPVDLSSWTPITVTIAGIDYPGWGKL